MTCNVSSGTLTLTHSLTHFMRPSYRPRYSPCPSVCPSVLSWFENNRHLNNRCGRESRSNRCTDFEFKRSEVALKTSRKWHIIIWSRHGLCSDLVHCQRLRRSTTWQMAVSHVGSRHLEPVFFLVMVMFKISFEVTGLWSFLCARLSILHCDCPSVRLSVCLFVQSLVPYKLLTRKQKAYKNAHTWPTYFSFCIDFFLY